MTSMAPGRLSAVLAGLSGALLRYRQHRARHDERLTPAHRDPRELHDLGIDPRAAADAYRRRYPTLLFDQQLRPGGW